MLATLVPSVSQRRRFQRLVPSAYDVAKIDVLDDTPNTSTGAGRAVEGPYPLAKLLNKIGKSYEKDKLLLSESVKSDRKEEKKEYFRTSVLPQFQAILLTG